MNRDDYTLYILRCSDGTLYTGIACDVPSRLDEHRSGARGAKYLRGRSPFALVFQRAVGDRSAAQRIEYYVKKLAKKDKLDLIAGRRQLPGASDDRG
jgi:putative endonuclease